MRSQQVHLDLRIVLKNGRGEPFMGMGPIWLLTRIAKYRSISAAAADMKLSYPKALRIIQSLEKGLRRQVVARFKGGRNHGGAQLTAFGRDFVRRYDRLQKRIKRFAAMAYAKEFPGS
jgi:molybdate transport system regulatory protein